MAPTFPLSLPAVGYNLCDFSLERQVAGARLRSGAAQRIVRGTDYWRVTYRTVGMASRADWQRVVTFLETLQFGLHPFLAEDPHKRFPTDYPNGFDGLVRAGTATAFDGTATVTAIDSAKLSLSGLPASFVLKGGDWLGLVQSGKYGLHRMQEDRTATALGVLANIYVSPAPLSTVFTTAATANFDRPKALMLLDPEPVSTPWTLPGQPIIFSAAQKVL